MVTTQIYADLTGSYLPFPLSLVTRYLGNRVI